MEDWLTAQEAAPLLGLSLQAFYTVVRENKLPAIRIGRRIRIDPQSLREWVKRGGSSDATGESQKTPK